MSRQFNDPARIPQLTPPAAPRRPPVRHPDLYGVWMVPLTQGKFALIDEADVERVARWTWSALNNNGRQFYAVTGTPTPAGRRNFLMHVCLAGFPSGCEVDHRDGNSLDNRRPNLRVCTHAQNGRNWTKRRPRTSRYKGVSWNTKRSLWVACIRFKKQQIYLGSFQDEVEAAEAYDAAAAVMFKEFAKLNFPEARG